MPCNKHEAARFPNAISRRSFLADKARNLGYQIQVNLRAPFASSLSPLRACTEDGYPTFPLTCQSFRPTIGVIHVRLFRVTSVTFQDVPCELSDGAGMSARIYVIVVENMR